jgi:8-oxo-dGTP diphosphatase
MERADIVSFIVWKDNKILVEKRSLTKKTDPGAIILPSGHVEKDESLEEACRRELKEELGLECEKFEFIIKLPHDTGIEEQMIHFYSCVNWKGEPRSHEAEKVFWIDANQTNVIDYEIDRIAIKEFLKKRE